MEPTPQFPRCRHSLYWPENQKVPWGCTFCRQAAGEDCFADITNPNRKTVRFHMPQCGTATNINDLGEFRTNKHSPEACPDCGSRFHVVLEDKQWECAECKRVFRGRIAGGRVSDE